MCVFLTRDASVPALPLPKILLLRSRAVLALSLAKAYNATQFDFLTF